MTDLQADSVFLEGGRIPVGIGIAIGIAIEFDTDSDSDTDGDRGKDPSVIENGIVLD